MSLARVRQVNAREKLESEILTTEWKMLAIHHRREALFLVQPTVPLLDVAIAIAEDRTEAVQQWLNSSAIARPTEAQLAIWENEDGARFRSVIVQPYVLAQRQR